jgi:hypothetical protein
MFMRENLRDDLQFSITLRRPTHNKGDFNFHSKLTLLDACLFYDESLGCQSICPPTVCQQFSLPSGSFAAMKILWLFAMFIARLVESSLCQAYQSDVLSGTWRTGSLPGSAIH